MASESLPVLPGMLMYVSSASASESSDSKNKKSKKKRLMSGSKKGRKVSAKKKEDLFELVRPEFTAQFFELAACFTSREISHMRTEDKKSLLHASVLTGNLAIQQFLVRETDIDINSQENAGRTAIHLAAKSGSMESMDLLLHQPVLDCSIRDLNGNTFLHYLASFTKADMNEYVGLLRLAFDKGASFFCNNALSETPLHIAARHGQSWALAFAQQRSVNPNLITKNWDTALHYAAQSGNVEGIKTLLKQGADRFTVNRHSQFPGDLLKKSRSSAEANDAFPPSPFLASLKKEGEKLLLTQIEKMKTVVKDNDRMTLLHYAVVLGRLRVVKAILQNKDMASRSVNSRNANGNTPVHYYCRLIPPKEHFALYFELLQQIAAHSNDLFAINYRSETPLHMAIITKNIISAKYLLQKGCPVNAPNGFGETPLHYATMCASIKIVKLLITYGAVRAHYALRPNVQPERPLDIAIKTFQHPIIFLLHVASTHSGPVNANRAITPVRPPLPASSTMASLDTWSEMYTNSSTSSSSMSSPNLYDHPLPNRALEEKFVVYECIGHGAHSVVHRALDFNSSKEFAVKTFRSIKNSQAIGNEVGILKMCNHPHIVRYHGFYQDQMKICVVMDFCQLGSLEAIRRMVVFSEVMLSYVAKSVLEGLAYLHSLGLAHRDLKGPNILMDEKGVVKITDFGVAKQYPTEGDSISLPGTQSEKGEMEEEGSVLSEGITAGTPLYMAPEVIEKKSSGTRADIWSFGVTMIALAEGAAPYSEHAKLAYIYASIVEGKAPRLPTRWTEPFGEFVERCCQKIPESRWSAKDLLDHKFLQIDEANARKDIEDVIQAYLGSSQAGNMSISELEEFVVDFRNRMEDIDTPSSASLNSSSVLSRVNKLALRSEESTGSLTAATLTTQTSPRGSSGESSEMTSSPSLHSQGSLLTDSESYISNPSGYTASYVTSSSLGGSSSSLMKDWSSEDEDVFTLWVRFGDMEVVPVEGLAPMSSVHDLKKHVKFHPELPELAEFSLPQLSLLDAKGNRLKPSGILANVLQNNDHIQVVLLDLSKFESNSTPPPPQPQLLSQPQLNNSSRHGRSSSNRSYDSDPDSSEKQARRE